MLMDVAERKPETKGALAGRVALVTGSTSGIGLGIARAFAGAGAAIILNGFGNADEIGETVSGLSAEYGVKAVYSPAECDDLIANIEQWGPTLATNNPGHRDQDRVMRDDPAIAADLLRRIRPQLPERMGALRLVGLNERLRFYRYRQGQQFTPHMDHWYWPTERRVTLHTVLAYFNADFEGGETRFIEPVAELVVPMAGRRGG